jgi:SAM-dependent methyltransferase
VSAEALAAAGGPAVSEDEARAFAREHGHYDEDLGFWRAAAARLGGPVLDLGAATGRVAIPLARAGAEVWALDGAPAMLAELGRRLAEEPDEVRRRVRPMRGDLRALDLGRRFPLVLIAMNTLQALLTPDDQLACLRGAREHLASAGELIFDVALPDLADITGALGVVRPGDVHRDPESGLTLVHSAWYEAFDPITQTLDFTLRIEERRGASAVREVLRRHRVHVFMPSELAHLLARAGLRPLAVLGDFAGGPVRADAERQVWRCAAGG